MNKHGWTYKKLGEVASYINGYPFKPESWRENGIPIIRIQNLNDDAAPFNYYEGHLDDKYIVRDGDLLISWSASLGVYVWRRGVAYLNQHIFKVIFDKGNINKYFLAYSVKSKLAEMSKNSHGSTMRHIVKKDFDNTRIPVPSMTEQEAIVAELDEINDVIAALQQQVADLDALAQSTFYTMFGDPVTNEKGWEVKKLADVSQGKLSYGSGASAIPYNGEIRYIRITDIKDNGDLNNEIVSPNSFDASYLLNQGDILFARSGATVGKTYMHKAINGKSIYAGYLIRLIPDQDIVIPVYVFHYTKTSYYRSFIENAQRAVAQPNINAKQYGNLSICVPPLALQQEFAAKVKEIEAAKAEIKAQITEMQTLLNSRMDYYFN